jgi:hypothetical protein
VTDCASEGGRFLGQKSQTRLCLLGFGHTVGDYDGRQWEGGDWGAAYDVMVVMGSCVQSCKWR